MAVFPGGERICRERRERELLCTDTHIGSFVSSVSEFFLFLNEQCQEFQLSRLGSESYKREGWTMLNFIKLASKCHGSNCESCRGGRF